MAADGGGDQRALVAAAAQGDRQARDELLAAMTPLLGALAGQQQASPPVELRQKAGLGVVQAAQRYDGSFDTPFAAYASWWVRQACSG